MRATSRRTIALVVAIAAVVLFGEVASRLSAQQSTRRVQRGGSAAIDAALQGPNDEQVILLREGAVLSDQLGTFQTTGDHVLFELTAQEQSLRVLENLALERVWNMLDDTRGRQWTVSGIVTEYRGRNFLLIHRAVLRSRSANTTAKP